MQSNYEPISIDLIFASKHSLDFLLFVLSCQHFIWFPLRLLQYIFPISRSLLSWRTKINLAHLVAWYWPGATAEDELRKKTSFLLYTKSAFTRYLALSLTSIFGSISSNRSTQSVQRHFTKTNASSVHRHCCRTEFRRLWSATRFSCHDCPLYPYGQQHQICVFGRY